MNQNDSPRRLIGRRQFLQVAGASAVLASPLLSGGRSALAEAATSGPAAVTVPLNANWLFGQSVSGGTQPGFDDSGLALVSVPHTVTPLSWRDWDAASWQQVWLYRKHFDAPAVSGGQRVFVDFAGAMTAATVVVNGQELLTHQGGYLPFTAEVTDVLQAKDNVVAVELDSRFLDVPPDGIPTGAIGVDYYEPGGLYRDVAVRVVPQLFVADVWAQPVNVLSSSRQVQVQCTVDAAVVPSRPVRLEVALADGTHVLSQGSAPVAISGPGQVTASLALTGLGGVQLWHVDDPKLYQVVATLYVGDQPIHDFTRRIGFREAVFQTDGFFLNGTRLKIFGLNRHQMYPYAGMAMPARVQRRDAEILKRQLNCNMVRCSHYPQSPAFLDACDELGIMVWQETPGWQYFGDDAWQQIMLQNVHDMVVRDRSRPSVVIWGVKPNETPHQFVDAFTEARDLAKSLDPSRPTSGTTYHTLNQFVFDVMAEDDYTHASGNAQLLAPIAGVPYLVTEAVGALDGPAYFRWRDTQFVQQTQAQMHAQVHNAAGGNNAYCGLLGWSGFDYDSGHANVYHAMKFTGVADTFRHLKPGAAFYQAQGDPAAAPVIAPAFYWDFGPTSPVTGLGGTATIWSNCDRIEAFLDGTHLASLSPDTAGYPNLAHAPFHLDVSSIDGSTLPELRLDGYVGSTLALSRSFASDPAGDQLQVTADDTQLTADGSDSTRIAFRAVDRYGAPRPYADGIVTLSVDGPGLLPGAVVALTVSAAPELLSPGGQATVSASLTNTAFPFAENGGVGAVYVRTLPGAAGMITVTATHPTLGSGTVRIRATTPQQPPDQSPVAAGHAPSQTLTQLALSLDAPDGWTIRPLTGTTTSQLAAGSTATARWQVTAPATVAPGASTTVTAIANFLAGGQPATTSTRAPVYLATTLEDAFNNVGISDDTNPSGADFDGTGGSYSGQALTAAGFAPGATVTHNGITFTWPNVPAGQPDNVLTDGHAILVSGSGSTLAFLGAATGVTTAIGFAKVFYDDGTSRDFSLLLDNYTALPGPENDIAATLAYRNGPNGRQNNKTYLYYVAVPIDPTKTVQAVALIDGGFVQPDTGNIRGPHVFAVAVGG